MVTDGATVLKIYETLINPGKAIPGFISGLTGIDQEMIRKAPSFSEVAPMVYELLKDCIFVAHQVNFDFSFIRKELLENGLEIQPAKLCTLRLSRKIFPGKKHYSLGNICGNLGIVTENRHRAMGDAMAAFQLLKLLLQHDLNGEIPGSLKRNNSENLLPPNLSRAQFDGLPNAPGVYYFLDEHRKVIYVGKAINIQKRVRSHFTGNVNTPQRQGFMREIHHIRFELTGNELVALLHETNEIKSLWPKYNRSQKWLERSFGIFSYIGLDGYQRLFIEVVSKSSSPPLFRYSSYAKALEALLQLVNQYQLCLRMVAIAHTGDVERQCESDCPCKGGRHSYNKHVEEMSKSFFEQQESFAVTAPGRTPTELAFVLIREGLYCGFGFIEASQFSIDSMNRLVRPERHTHNAIPVILNFASKKGDEYRTMVLD